MTLTVALALVAGVVLLVFVVQGALASRRASQRKQESRLAELDSRVEPSMLGEASSTQPPDAAASRPGRPARQPVQPRAAAAAPTVRPLQAVAARPEAPSPQPAAEPPITWSLEEDPAAEPEAPAPAEAAPAASVLAAKATRRAARIDPLIDLVATVSPESLISGDLALSHFPKHLRVGTKPIHIEGLSASTGDWERVSAGRRYSEFQVAVQMANRLGAINAIEYSEFVTLVHAFGDALGAMCDAPEMHDALARATELDGFAGQFDLVLAVYLRARQAGWAPGWVAQCAARRGFEPSPLPGRMVLPSPQEGAPPVLVLQLETNPPSVGPATADGLPPRPRVVLSLDVPQSPAEQEPFGTLQTLARHLADELDAALVDERDIPITLHQFAVIDHDLAEIYRALQARDLAAGSYAARRVFS